MASILEKPLESAADAAARARFAEQAGAILARIHAIDPDGLGLRAWSLEEEMADLRRRYESGGTLRPVFELAFRWLAAHRPRAVARRTVFGRRARRGSGRRAGEGRHRRLPDEPPQYGLDRPL